MTNKAALSGISMRLV